MTPTPLASSNSDARTCPRCKRPDFIVRKCTVQFEDDKPARLTGYITHTCKDRVHCGYSTAFIPQDDPNKWHYKSGAKEQRDAV